MNPNSEEFLNFLRSMGVDMERSQEHSRHESQPPREPRDPDVLQEEPAITILQQSRERDAFYQLNLIQTIPQLRVVLPEKEGMLKFQIYLVLFSGQHPLASIFSLLASYSGSWQWYVSYRLPANCSKISSGPAWIPCSSHPKSPS